MQVVEIKEIDGVKIRCQFHELLNPNEINPHPKNPNTHPPKQLELFSKILDYQGIRRCITISKRSNFVTRGHGLMLTARIKGLSKVPVEWQEYENEEQEIADLIADNQLAEWSEIDKGLLKNAIQELDTGNLDLEVTGFDIPSLENLMTEGNVFPEFDSPAGNEGNGPQDQSAPPTATDAPDGGSINSLQVKMVQLFLNEETFPEFERIVSHFQPLFDKSNATDTVMEVLRRAYEANTSDSAGTFGVVGSVPGEETPAH